MIRNSFQNRVLGKSLFGAAMLVCALWGAAQRPLALPAAAPQAVERLPGHIARPTGGRQIVARREATGLRCCPSAGCACAGPENG